MNAHPQPTEDGASADQASPPGPPPARLLRLPEVIDRVGLRRSAIYQRMSEGRFPKSRSLGPKCTVWVEEEIDAWIRSIADKPHRDAR
ncbi:AlpA family transcriptional regulator [Sphingopyxis granuli]|nr:AlpA family transcriptional regulator [Sphingopyxis granuli]QUM71711.1 AlpA family transcriptional regulator [Sphingopyxis granuli]